MPARPRLPLRLIALSTVLALIAAIGTYVVLDDGEDTVTTSTPRLDLTPEADLPTLGEVTFTTFDGEEVTLASLRGTPLLVNFFASTCTPCITEMPEFERVYQEVKNDVAFLGLAVADRPDDARSLVEQTGVTYPTAQDPDGSVIAVLEGTVLPTTVLLDADGAVLARRSGRVTADELRSLLSGELGLAR